MKNTSFLLFFLFCGLGLSAQLDLSINLYDFGWQGGSLYFEKPVSKRTALEVGLISRVITRNIYSRQEDLIESEQFDNDGLITRLDYKIYFSKRRLEHNGWYFSLFNRNVFVYNWDENYKDRWIERFGPTLGEDEHLTDFVQSIELGWTIGFKRVYKNNIIFFTSIGYSIELFPIIRKEGYGAGDLVGHLGIGYRFNSKKKEKLAD